MAGHAADALLNVDAMVEIDEIGHAVHAVPLEGFVCEIALPDRLEQGAVGPYLRMACEAGFRRRDARERRPFDAGMAVPAIYSQLADVVLMAKRGRLVERYAHPVRVGRDVRADQHD